MVARWRRFVHINALVRVGTVKRKNKKMKKKQNVPSKQVFDLRARVCVSETDSSETAVKVDTWFKSTRAFLHNTRTREPQTVFECARLNTERSARALDRARTTYTCVKIWTRSRLISPRQIYTSTLSTRLRALKAYFIHANLDSCSPCTTRRLMCGPNDRHVVVYKTVRTCVVAGVFVTGHRCSSAMCFSTVNKPITDTI